MVPATVVQGTWKCAQDGTNSTSEASGATSGSSKGLSGGTIAGIAIGAVVGVLCIVVGIVYFLKKKSKAKSQNAAKEPERARSRDDFFGGERKGVARVAEMHSPDRGTVKVAGNGRVGLAEMHSPERAAAEPWESRQGGRAELDDGRTHARHELPENTMVYGVSGDGPAR